jgi:hypothetical protein
MSNPLRISHPFPFQINFPTSAGKAVASATPPCAQDEDTRSTASPPGDPKKSCYDSLRLTKDCQTSKTDSKRSHPNNKKVKRCQEYVLNLIMFCTQTPSFHGADTAHKMFFLSRPRSGRASACSKGPRAHSADSRPWEAMWQRILERKICLNHFQVLMQSQSESKQYSILHKYTKIIRTGCEAYDRTSFDSVS